MSRSALIKIGCALIAIALLVGIIPGIATLMRDTATDTDTTQEASNIGSALTFLLMCLPVLVVGAGMIIVGLRKDPLSDPAT